MTLVALLTSVVGCGHKGPPMPPPNMAPQTTQDIKVHQRGFDLLVDFAYPQVTVSGSTLEGLEVVEIWSYVQPIPEVVTEGELAAGDEASGAEAGAEPGIDQLGPPPGENEAGDQAGGASEVDIEVLGEPEVGGDQPNGDEVGGEEADEDEAAEDEIAELSLEEQLRADPREFAAAARLHSTVRNPELQRKIVGDRIFLELALDQPLPEPPEVHNIAVRTFSVSGRPSQLSTHVVLIPRLPPAAPVDLTASGAADGVVLAWTAGEEELTGFLVYRREIRDDGFDQPIGKVAADAESYTDRSALFGHDYAYSVSAVTQQIPLIESSLAQATEIRYEDRFAPQAPQGLVALSGTEGVRLLWEAGRAIDLAGYIIYRQERGTAFEPLTEEPLTDNEFVDTGVTVGRAYTYMVKAVDGAGNLSPASEPVDARP